MDAPYRGHAMPEPASAHLTPQDILTAVNKDPQAVLQYIISLESDINRLKREITVSREEMFTVIQISMRAVAQEMSKTLSVTKNSLVGIQEQFHRIAASRVEGLEVTRPGVIKSYQDDGPSQQSPGKKKTATEIFTTVLGGGNGLQCRLDQDFLTSPSSPRFGKCVGIPQPISPVKQTINRFSPTKATNGSGIITNAVKTQHDNVFASPSGNQVLHQVTVPALAQVSPIRVNLPSTPLSTSHLSKPAESLTTLETPPLSVRSNSQQNVGKVDSKQMNDAFIKFMAHSHLKARSYRDTPQTHNEKLDTLESVIIISEDFGEAKNNKVSRPSGSVIKYDIAFLKTIGKSCKRQANPFAGNTDDELKLVLEWERDSSRNRIPNRQTPHRAAQAGNRQNTSQWN